MKKYILITFLYFCIFTPVLSQDSTKITVILPDTGKQFDLGVGRAITKIPSEITHGMFAQMELIEFPGYKTPLHVHDHTTEVFYVVEGTLTVLIDGVLQTVEPGGFVFIPQGTPHAQGNFTDSDLRTIVTFYPGGFEKFFEARSEIVKLYTPGTKRYGEEMRKLGREYDIRIIEHEPFGEQ